MVWVAYQEDEHLQIFPKRLFNEGIQWEISSIMRKVILPDTIINEYYYGLNSATTHYVKTYNWFRSSCESCGVPSWLTIFCIDETERYCKLLKHVHACKYNFKLRELLEHPTVKISHQTSCTWKPWPKINFTNSKVIHNMACRWTLNLFRNTSYNCRHNIYNSYSVLLFYEPSDIFGNWEASNYLGGICHFCRCEKLSDECQESETKQHM